MQASPGIPILCMSSFLVFLFFFLLYPLSFYSISFSFSLSTGHFLVALIFKDEIVTNLNHHLNPTNYFLTN